MSSISRCNLRLPSKTSERESKVKPKVTTKEKPYEVEVKIKDKFLYEEDLEEDYEGDTTADVAASSGAAPTTTPKPSPKIIKKEVPTPRPVDEVVECYGEEGRPKTNVPTPTALDQTDSTDQRENEINDELKVAAEKNEDDENEMGAPHPEPAHECEDFELTQGGNFDESDENAEQCHARDTADSLQKHLSRDTYEAFQHSERRCAATECRKLGDEEVCDQPPPDFFCPGTPGDAETNFAIAERPESPYLTTDLTTFPVNEKGEKVAMHGAGGEIINPPIVCKSRYKPKKYIKMWGSEESVRRWTIHRLENKMKRKSLERKHAKNSWLRERMRDHARVLRRQMRCKDQSQIPSTSSDAVNINKAYYFRFNYNKEIPCMPVDIYQHLEKFRKPPFKRFQKGKKACFKYIDDFDKLRICDIPLGDYKMLAQTLNSDG